jgi:hypothetical protein
VGKGVLFSDPRKVFGLKSFLFSSLVPFLGVFPLFTLLVEVGLRLQNAILIFRAPLIKYSTKHF